jgi:hypothetical protein
MTCSRQSEGGETEKRMRFGGQNANPCIMYDGKASGGSSGKSTVPVIGRLRHPAMTKGSIKIHEAGSKDRSCSYDRYEKLSKGAVPGTATLSIFPYSPLQILVRLCYWKRAGHQRSPSEVAPRDSEAPAAQCVLRTRRWEVDSSTENRHTWPLVDVLLYASLWLSLLVRAWHAPVTVHRLML